MIIAAKLFSYFIQTLPGKKVFLFAYRESAHVFILQRSCIMKGLLVSEWKAI